MNRDTMDKLNKKHWVVIICLITFLTISLAFVVEQDVQEDVSITTSDVNSTFISVAALHSVSNSKRMVAYIFRPELGNLSMYILQLEYLGAVSIIYFFYIIHRIIPVGSKAPPLSNFDV